MRHGVSLLIAALLAVLQFGCAGSLQSEPPTPLTEFEREVEVRAAWSRALGAWETASQGRTEPVVMDGRLVVVDGNHRLRAFDARTGKPLWERASAEIVSGSLSSGDDLLWLGTQDAEVLGIRPDNGALAVRYPVSSEVLVAPSVAQGTVIVRSGDGKLIALNAEDGSRRWVFERSVPVLSLRGTGAAVLAERQVLAGFANGKLVSVALSDGSVQWEATVAVAQGRSELDRMVDVDADPLPTDDVVFTAAFQGRVMALTRSAGQTLWSREISVFNSLALDDDNLYLSDEDGQVWALDRRTGNALWKQDALRYRAVSAPVVYGDYLVVTDYQGYLHVLDRHEGRLIGRYRVDPAGVVGRPYAAQGLLYVIGRSGVVEAMRLR